MPSRWRLRRVFGPLVKWLAGGFVKLGLGPNSISGLAFLVALGAALVLHLWQWYLAYGGLVFLAGVLDGVDGEVARRTERTSLRGGFVDSMLDRISDLVVLAPFLWTVNPWPQLGPTWWWVTAAMTGSLLVSYARSRAQAAGVLDTDVGLAARSERLFILVVTSLLSVLHPGFPYLGVILVAILSHLTVLYRILYYRRQLHLMVTPKP
ncbi:MAG: CDP-alcohol phosphatidyltransferase family protein [Candidatus Hodarchaeota archaeon]